MHNLFNLIHRSVNWKLVHLTSLFLCLLFVLVPQENFPAITTTTTTIPTTTTNTTTATTTTTTILLLLLLLLLLQVLLKTNSIISTAQSNY
jgi:small neutral amino acid transporter SnatA (MarC family)